MLAKKELFHLPNHLEYFLMMFFTTIFKMKLNTCFFNYYHKLIKVTEGLVAFFRFLDLDIL